MFRKAILFLIFIFCLSGFAFAQNEKYSAPVKWERYKVSGKEVSILLPKFPILINRSDICAQKQTQIYAAYAEEVVYTFSITSKLKGSNRDFCFDNKKDFDEQAFTRRLDELQKNSPEKIEVTKHSQNGREVFQIRNKITAYWLFNDFENKRWFELWVTHRDDAKPKVAEFIESIEFGSKPKGTEIGEGSDRTLGDLTEKPVTPSDQKDEKTIQGKGSGGGIGSGSTGISNENLDPNSDKKGALPIIVVQKVQARYTDAARQANVQGTVTLRVTFLANGGIGAISPVSELPYGLTEQAIAAAAKIVFLPAKRNGVSISTAKTVAYSFSIY